MSTLEVKPVSLSNPSLYINRDLSLLEFQRRVLNEALDKKTPLLERIKFLAIFGSNMDEFFMLRIPGIRRRAALPGMETSLELVDPANQMAAVHQLASELYTTALQCLQEEILPKLKKSGISMLDYAKLSKHQKERVHAYFKKTISPLLIPLPLSRGHPLPHISNLYLNLAVVLRDRKDNVKLMRLQVPDALPRLFPVKHSSGSSGKNGKVAHQYYFIWLEQIIIAHLEEVFPDMKVIEVHPFRIIRDAALQVDDLEADELFGSVEESIEYLNIQRREFGAVTQVAIYKNMPDAIRTLLTEVLEVGSDDFYIKGNPLGLRSLWELYSSVRRADLKYRPYEPTVSKVFKHMVRPRDVFETIHQENILLHHPYDSFSPVVDFITFAARDSKVLTIRQTLYRVGQDSPVVKALMDASVRGKEVTAVIELKATFDEESNMGWARLLEQAGVNVIHGVQGLKTHCKIGMVVRQEKEGLRRYLHLATGNYNAVTSRTYEDIGMFTCDQTMGEDGAKLFDYLMGYSTDEKYQKFLVAPFDLRQRLEALIRREMEHSRLGLHARMIFKVNSLVDSRMINLLYEASQAGVYIDLLVRGMCSLRPGVRDLSENINVISIVGRYLEHSRIFYFLNGGQEEIYLGSADLMERNLNRRVELLFPLENSEHIRHIREDVLDTYLQDNQLAYVLQPDGTYQRKEPGVGERPVNVQNWLMRARRK
ncbi:MAG TPA: polyphosphate kinase 1 [Anaerolineales bacterium]|nr:polyphosphate kinase 1 [Anaerolineales bacterium]